jgi:hypothetical protein
MKNQAQLHLIESFLNAMDDIGLYGYQKYGTRSFEYRMARGDKSRGDLVDSRTGSVAIAAHAKEHFDAYLAGELHDHFLTKKHQLAAVAFNAMMEYYFAGLEEEEK